MTDFPVIDFHDFHLRDLPLRLASGNGLKAATAAREFAAISFIISGSDNAYTYLPGSDSIAIVAGTEAETIIELAQESWQGLVHDLESAPGLLYGGNVTVPRGDPMLFILWEPALRAMFHGRPLYEMGVPIKSSQGSVLDPAASFSLANDAAGITEFLDAAGYVLLKNLFSTQELLRLREQAENLKHAAKEGDQTSWWGKNKNGDAVLTRVIHAAVLLEFRNLYQHPNIKTIESLLTGLVAMSPDEVDGVTVVYKNPNMVAGLSDLPWHRDCGLGGHAVMCPKIVCSIYLYDATSASGALKFLPGSHKASFGFMDANDNAAPMGITVAAKAGDVSLHYSDVIHCAPPPNADSDQYRVSVLLNFDRDFQHHAGRRHYNDVLLGSNDGQIDHLATVVDKA